ncbi:hypothetical protein [Pelomonas sp. KK5]|uniref:hypothetical protein n=1 Tax=Pelomonas sp. KK5 TaxID=1855730 RepID=UPI0009FA47DB|nr:hypothetical protein [Pelomonas sp. KK5]
MKAVSPKTIVWIERFVWILIYGGLLTVIVGLFITRQDAPVLGSVLMVKGGIAAGAGVFLIWLRSRLKPKDS